jgi:site-specific DNA-methyltransferase (adenine-specific)
MYQLYNGDCVEVMKQLVADGVIVDAIIADPPYIINYTDWDKEFNLSEAIDLCYELLKSDGNLVLFQGWSNVCDTKYLLDKKFTIQNWIVWDRIKGRGAKKNFVSTREDILWYCKGDNPTYKKMYSNIPKKTGGLGKKNGQENRALTNVWYDISPIAPWSKEKVDHPTQKPTQLMERCVAIWTNESDTVLDFTMGSGSTGVACVNTGRNFIGIEKDENYFQIAKKRIEEVNNLWV